MRVGKKLKVVETKKTRSCVVRLEKVRTPSGKGSQNADVGSSSSAKTSPTQDEKKFKGPLKKRPIAHTLTTPKFKEKFPTDYNDDISPISSPIMESTPTIAAGRSRRAIKPNPKYASSDMVTPKMIKNVATLAVSGNKKLELSGLEKKRKRSTSSSEDFYNKDSSDAEFGEFDEVKDKAYKADEKDSDSDFSDIEIEMPRIVRGRGRPKNSDIAALEKARAQAALTLKGLKAAASNKGTPSQLQLLRKTIIASNANRSLPLQLAKKRKVIEAESNDSDSDSMMKRKKLFSASITNKESTPSTLSQPSPIIHKTLISRKNLSSQTLNGSKVVYGTLPKPDLASTQEKRKAMLEKTMVKAKSVIQNPIEDQDTPQSNVKPTVIRQRTSSPATPKLLKSGKETDNKLETSPSATTDDFETMPTFTIVNINDIINKKGDVLISKANALSKQSKTQSKNNEETSDADEDTNEEPNSKPGRRKIGVSTLADKTDTSRFKNPSIRTPVPPKKPAQTILNHTLSNKNLNKINQRIVRSSTMKASSSGKPAPRILNSMVAKKTLPVKPMIANLDDSADETYPLLDEEMGGEEEEEEDTFIDKRRTKSPFPSKKPAAGTKENSLAATNRMPATNTKTTQRKISPEKVVISRQGDKIIKKITCFETWYIINLPEDRPAEVIRNQLDIPLIKLANASKSLELPSDSWSSKVTLYQLSSTLLAKSNYASFTGDLSEQNIAEEDRAKYQPSCVMFRRSVSDRSKSRLPYDRAVIFKNKTFFTNIEGKNVKLVGAPFKISSLAEVEILLQLVDELTLQNSFVEQTTTVQ